MQTMKYCANVRSLHSNRDLSENNVEWKNKKNSYFLIDYLYYKFIIYVNDQYANTNTIRHML